MYRLFYSALLSLTVPFVFLRFWRLSLSEPEYRRRWRERLGRPAVSPARSLPLVWVHAVSVGEANAARTLIAEWQRRQAGVQFLVTTTTPAASALVQSWKYPVLHQYMPFDLVTLYRSLFLHYKPRLIVVLETELWPNLLHLARRSETPVVVANARLSDRSARGYRRFGALTRPGFEGLARVLVQTEEDAANFRACGAPEERIEVTGSVKYDLALTSEQRSLLGELRTSCEGRPVIVAGSIHPGEEDLVIRSLRSLMTAYPDLLMVIAPRHRDRFEVVAEKLEKLNIRFRRRSEGDSPSPHDRVWLLDTLGELTVFYGIASVAILGGSWIDHGGHNPIEPASLGVTMITGPSSFNFQEAVRVLRKAGVLQQVKTNRLTGALLESLKNREAREEAGARGKALVARNQGATGRQVDALQRILR